jgi:hypothetical protein
LYVPSIHTTKTHRPSLWGSLLCERTVKRSLVSISATAVW